MARHSSHGREDPAIANSTGFEMIRDHSSSLSGKRILRVTGNGIGVARLTRRARKERKSKQEAM
jgi:hypothetical protein